MFAYDLTRALDADGFEQHVVLLRGPDGTSLEFIDPVVLGTNGFLLPGLRIDPRSVRGLRGRIARWKPDVVQTHGGEPLKYAVPAAAGLSCRIVHRKIGSAPPEAQRGLRRSAHARLMRRAARVVAVAESMRREAIEVFNLPPDHVLTIPRGVDPERMHPLRSRTEIRRSLGIPARAPVVLTLGALSAEKDPLGQVSIARRALAEVPDLVMVMAGDGPLRGAVEAEVERAGLAQRIRVLGSRPDVSDLLAASDLLLLASHTEGMPGVVIEAGMAGLPVAAFGVSGVPEVVTDELTGLLAPPRDLPALTARVVRLALDRALRRQLGTAARERCRSSFDISVVASQFSKLYVDVTGKA
jgi:glycosyltransferase involved in cell wall biosynthesis